MQFTILQINKNFTADLGKFATEAAQNLKEQTEDIAENLKRRSSASFPPRFTSSETESYTVPETDFVHTSEVNHRDDVGHTDISDNSAATGTSSNFDNQSSLHTSQKPPAMNPAQHSKSFHSNTAIAAEDLKSRTESKEPAGKSSKKKSEKFHIHIPQPPKKVWSKGFGQKPIASEFKQEVRDAVNEKSNAE